MSKSIFLLSIILTLVAACGGEEGIEQQEPPKPKYQNIAPTLHVASPSDLKVGDNLMILGQNFIHPTNGYTTLVLKGTFFDDNGGQQVVDLQYKPIVVDSGKVSWKMWPNIVFDKTGNHLGYFLGSIAVINMAKDGTQKVSDNLPVRINIKPSLIPRVARPTKGGCQLVVGKTTENEHFAFTVEAVGLRPGTKDNPLTFYWSFLFDQWDVSMSYGTMDPNTVLPKTGAFMLEESVTSGLASSVAGGGSASYLVQIGKDLKGTSGLKTLKTKTISGPGDSYNTSVNVTVVDSANKSVSLSIPIEVFKLVTMTYDGLPVLAQRFAPVMVSDCMSGGDIGRQVSYSEDHSESRSRTLSFNINASVGINVAPIPSNPFALGINFNAGFGIDTSATMHTSKSKGLNLSGQILPSDYGVFYRQTTKWYRYGTLTVHNSCGQSASLGQVVLTDWTFTPDLATGPSCIPPTKLQPAQKFK